MTRDPNASLSLAKFFAPAPPLCTPVDVTGWTPEELDDLADNDAWSEAADADDLARWEARRRGQFFQQARATLTDDPLRGDPDCPTVRHLVALLHRPRTLAAAFFAGADRGRASFHEHAYVLTDVRERTVCRCGAVAPEGGAQ